MPDGTSGYTKNEIIVRAIFPIGYQSSDITGDLETILNGYFDDSLLKFGKVFDWRHNHITSTFTLNSGNNTIDFSSVGISVSDIEALYIYTDGKERRVFPTDYRKIVNADPDQDRTGTPCYYGWWGETTILLDKTLDADLDFRILYKQTPQMITDSGEYPSIPRRLQRHLINYIKWQLASDKGDSRAASFQSTFKSELLEDIQDEVSKRDSAEEYDQPEDGGLAHQPTMEDFYAKVY